MESVRVNADIEQTDEGDIKQCGPPDAKPSKAPWRRPEWRIQKRNGTQPSKSARKFQVFHQGDVGKAAQFLKNRCFYEDGLVAEQRSANRMQPSDERLPPLHPEVPIVKPAMKRTAQDHFVSGGSRQSTNVFVTQLRVTVMKTQQRPACCDGPGIHLSATRRLVARDQADDTASIQITESLGWTNGDHYPLSKLRRNSQTVHQIDDQIVIAPDRNN